jgi:ElaB/YqjD/DUF883 family membrane-anchored ribosome-binding protein
MIKVKGIDYKTVDLPDLGDRIFFGQTKLFTVEQVAASADLNNALKNGKVVLLSESSKVPLYSPKVITPKEVTPVPVVESTTDKDVEELKGKLQEMSAKLEAVELKATAVAPVAEEVPNQTSELLGKLNDAMAIIQQSLTAQKDETVKAVQESAARMEKTVSGLSIAGPGVGRVTQRDNSTSTDEIYIPSTLSVTDMTNHITLETKNVGQGDNVRNSLNKLRSLKTQKPNT